MPCKQEEKSTDGGAGSGDPAIGLCADCRWTRPQPTRKGQVFHRCARAEMDDRFLRYPPLPVRVCPGFEPSEGSRHAAGPGAVRSQRSSS